MSMRSILGVFFFFNDTATTEIYTLSLHDALPISGRGFAALRHLSHEPCRLGRGRWSAVCCRSEEHTSELQSQSNLVCRLLLEKKNNTHCQHRCQHKSHSPELSQYSAHHLRLPLTE